MTIHVNIGEAKTRLSELVAAAVRGEEVILAKAGEPQVRLVAVPAAQDEVREKVRAKRLAALGMFREELAGYDFRADEPSMTDEQLEERWRRKFGPPA